MDLLIVFWKSIQLCLSLGKAKLCSISLHLGVFFLVSELKRQLTWFLSMTIHRSVELFFSKIIGNGSPSVSNYYRNSSESVNHSESISFIFFQFDNFCQKLARFIFIVIQIWIYYGWRMNITVLENRSKEKIPTLWVSVNRSWLVYGMFVSDTFGEELLMILSAILLERRYIYHCTGKADKGEKVFWHEYSDKIWIDLFVRFHDANLRYQCLSDDKVFVCTYQITTFELVIMAFTGRLVF